MEEICVGTVQCNRPREIRVGIIIPSHAIVTDASVVVGVCISWLKIYSLTVIYMCVCVCVCMFVCMGEGDRDQGPSLGKGSMA